MKEQFSTVHEEALTKEFMRLLGDATVRDVVEVLRTGELQRRVYVFDVNARTALRADHPGLRGTIPWPILWLLGAQHKTPFHWTDIARHAPHFRCVGEPLPEGEVDVALP